MSDLFTELTKEKDRILKCKANLTTKKSPGDMSIYTSSSHGCVQYRIVDKKSKANRYLKRNEIELASKICQWKYEQKLLNHYDEELIQIKKLIDILNCNELNIFQSMPQGKQRIVKPIILPDSEYVSLWESVQYVGKAFSEDAAEIYSEKGFRVRSKSEKILSDKFWYYGVPQRYEYPVSLKSFGTVYPDFILLNVKERKSYLWEHFGMMDKPDYCEKAIKKIETYAKNGIMLGEQLIATFETSSNPLDTKLVDTIIKEKLL